MHKLSIILAILLYILIYFLRLQQGGFEINLDLFPKIRQSLDQTITQDLPSPQAELLSGILLGNKKNLPGQLKIALRDSSTLHIVVVSGQNLTLLAALIMKLAGLIKRKWAILLAVCAIIFYTIMTGAQIPVLRAAVMAILTFAAQITGRQKHSMYVLSLTAALMLLVNPDWLFDLSFQLSFLATLGVISIGPILEKALKFMPEFIRQDLAITIGAQIMVLPIIAQYFHQISIVGIFANLLIGWTIPIIMIFGTLMIFLGPIFSIAANIFLTYFIYIVYFFSSLSFAWEYVGEQNWLIWVGYYLLIAGILLALHKKLT